MKVVTVIGARPQFIKAAPVAKAMQAAGIEEILVHTGQHYDAAMSEIFFQELSIPAPKYNLELGGGSHGAMTGQMLEGIEKILIEEKPDWVMVYGDTNSTIAGALAASKLHIPVCHVEAGLRSYNRQMPEEINRVLTDHISEILLCSSEVGVKNLAKEGITAGVQEIGDVMLDATLLAQEVVSGREAEFIKETPPELLEENYALLTLHRAENTDSPERLRAIVEQLNALEMPVIYPVHPRTKQALERDSLELAAHVHQIAPVGYLEMAVLLGKASLVISDSGGLQKEAYWAKKPLLILRDETEWVEIVESGWARLVAVEEENFAELATELLAQVGELAHPNLYGQSGVSAQIAALLKSA